MTPIYFCIYMIFFSLYRNQAHKTHSIGWFIYLPIRYFYRAPKMDNKWFDTPKHIQEVPVSSRNNKVVWRDCLFISQRSNSLNTFVISFLAHRVLVNMFFYVHRFPQAVVPYNGIRGSVIDSSGVVRPTWICIFYHYSLGLEPSLSTFFDQLLLSSDPDVDFENLEIFNLFLFTYPFYEL